MPQDAEPQPDAANAPPRRTAVRRVTVTAEDAGQRLDKVLARLLGNVPRSHCYRLLRKGEVRVNGRRASADQRLEEGDELRIPPLRIEAAPQEGAAAPRVPRALIERIEAAIIHEDERLLVVDKPAGIAAAASTSA
jgi:23S rRNA pseudouridine955/2504/2580 synthase